MLPNEGCFAEQAKTRVPSGHLLRPPQCRLSMLLHQDPDLVYSFRYTKKMPLDLQEKEDTQQTSIIPRIWRSTQKRPLSAESGADIRSLHDADDSLHASPCVMHKPYGSPINGLAILPDTKATSLGSPGKGIQGDDSDCLIKAHTGVQALCMRDGW